ncbi:ABC transporter substrate-binding protein [Pseudolabrys taiwanensis]|uniref:ABC transporter substrate-binding protein n=1 Tax=Pseudolabrys taiwanensis TaxID=331696 RepID=A0A345ZXB7_9HYPH|nr:ABC transporter substrate-binding protein [Pseudolabrys taiwanensis]AXK81564.1 ABC transporter substrate-binding protein [Pseudolabrys taiwanensis]
MSKFFKSFHSDACCGPHDGGGITRRGTLDYLARGGLAALLAAKGIDVAKAQTNDDVVRIGYLPITDATALLVAHANGYFEEAGLKVEAPVLIRSWSALVEGFASGKFNVVHLLKPIPVWMRYNNKFPVKILAWGHTNGSGLVVGGDTGITKFSDLGGKRIAVPFWYSMHNIVLQYALRQSGVKPVIKPESAALAADECALQILAPPDMPTALAAKKIHGYIVAEPFNALGELRAGAKMLRFTGDIWKNHPCCVICTHESYTRDKPEWAQKVTDSIVRAHIFASKNKAEVAKLISRDGKGYLPAPADVVVKAVTDYGPAYEKSGAIRHRDWKNGRIDFQPWPYPSATKLIVDNMNKTLVEGNTTFLKGLDPEFVAEDLVDYRFVKEAINKNPDWLNDPSVDRAHPFERQEILAL